jgi:hypothetical protein
VPRLELEHALEVRARRRCRLQQQAEEVVRLGVVGREAERAAQRTNRDRFVAQRVIVRGAERDVRVRQRRRAAHRLFGQRDDRVAARGIVDRPRPRDDVTGEDHRIVGNPLARLREQRDRRRRIAGVVVVIRDAGAQVELDADRIHRARLGAPDVDGQHFGDRARDSIVEREDVAARAVEPTSPQLHAVGDADRARRDAERIRGAAHAALDDDLDVELAAELARIAIAAGVPHDHAARAHAQPARDAERIDQILGQRVGDERVLGRAEVAERQHRDALVGGDRHQSGLGARRRGAGAGRRRAARRDRRELRRDLRHRRESLAARASEATRHDRGEPGVEIRLARQGIGRRLDQAGRRDRDHRLAVPRRRAGHELVEQRAERVDVGALVDVGGALDLLRRHVRRRADEAADGLRGIGARARDPEIGHHDPPVAREQHVLRLEVAVDHAGGVRGADAGADRARDREHAGDGQRLARDPRGERFAVDELHGQHAFAVEVAEIVDARDVGMRDPARELDLAAEPLERPRRSRQLGPQDLERDRLVELEVARLVDVAHSAGAQQPDDLVARADRPLRCVEGRLERRLRLLACHRVIVFPNARAWLA